MTGFNRRIGWGAAVLELLLGLLLAGSAAAQENLDSGKTPAQLYASDCAICHKTPQGLSKGFGPLGLQPFLREHYTASREAAAAIAGYVEAMDRGAAPAERGPKRKAKPKDAGKPGEKSNKAKTDAKGEAKGDTKSDAKISEPAKPAEAKPTEPAPAQAKTDAAKPAEKSADKPPADAKADNAKSDSNKPAGEKKPD